ncbi:MAG: M20/M25/M40 family metallo-hydrolase [Planctomycetota bacterium]|nr:M20/M25/M40 family metallo-hydrolase [Planctomycetota bacterium]
MNLPRSLMAALVLPGFLAVQLPSQSDRSAAIIREGMTRSEVMQFQDSLFHEYGSRLTGSLAYDRAADWALEQFQAMGLEARLEQWGEWQTGWDRGQWMGRMTAPHALELQVACPAWTGSTRGIARGELVPMPEDDAAFEQLAARAAKLAEAGDGTGSDMPRATAGLWLYGPLPDRGNPLRERVVELLEMPVLPVHGIVQSATSTGWNSDRYENQIRVFGDRNTALLPFEDRPRWAHAVVRDDQCKQLEEALAGEEPVQVEFELRNRFRRGPIVLNNVVADLVGTEYPDEYVIVCAHLDSWHQATGATDNGTGTCTTLEAARILSKVGVKPKRTIRFILWGGEEQGLLGSRQHVVKNRTRMHKVSALFNHDSGTNWAHALRIPESQADDFRKIVQPILDNMQAPQANHEGPVFELRTVPVLQPAGGGSDHASFGAVGVPAFGWSLKGEVPYGRGWHSQWDTWTIVVPDYQRHTATVIAVIAYGVANLDHMLSREGVERARPRQRGPVTAQLVIESWLGIELDGTKVTSVSADSRAGAADLRAGDVITQIGEETVGDTAEFLAALRKANEAGKTVKIQLSRGEQPVEVELTF